MYEHQLACLQCDSLFVFVQLPSFSTTFDLSRMYCIWTPSRVETEEVRIFLSVCGFCGISPSGHPSRKTTPSTKGYGRSVSKHTKSSSILCWPWGESSLRGKFFQLVTPSHTGRKRSDGVYKMETFKSNFTSKFCNSESEHLSRCPFLWKLWICFSQLSSFSLIFKMCPCGLRMAPNFSWEILNKSSGKSNPVILQL